MTTSLANLTRQRLEREARLADVGLTTCLCESCHRRWSTNAGPADHFDFIVHFCPDCLAKLAVRGPL